MVSPVHHLVGAREIAAMLGLTRQRVHQLSQEAGFPKPVASLGLGNVWETSDVEEWAATNRPDK
jgi:predicted DNA-binding transcriptional regulator AlpA